MGLNKPTWFLATAISATEIETEWGYTGTGHTGFEIHGRKKGEASYRLFATESPDDKNKTIRGLTLSTSYEFKVRAMNGATAGPFSDMDGSTTKAATTPTPTPTPNPEPTPSGFPATSLTPYRTSPASAQPVTTKTIRVTSLSQLKTLASGTNYVVAPGTYDTSTTIKVAGVTDVSISAEDASNPPVFRYTGGNTTSTNLLSLSGTRIRVDHLRFDTKAIVNTAVYVNGTDVTVHDIATINVGKDSTKAHFAYVWRTGRSAKGYTLSGCRQPLVSRYWAYPEIGSERGDFHDNVIGDSAWSHIWRSYAKDINVWNNDLSNQAFTTAKEARRAVINLKRLEYVCIWGNKNLAGGLGFGPLADGNGTEDADDPSIYLRHVRVWHNDIDLIKNESITLEAGVQDITFEANQIRTYKTNVFRVDAEEPFLSTRGLPQGVVRNNVITGPPGVKLFIGDASKIKQEGNAIKVA